MTVRTKFIDERTTRLLRETEQWRPPVRLDAIAARLGVVIEESDLLPADTRAVFDPRRAVIQVADLPELPRRFSIAHELGHAALDHGDACSFEGEPSMPDVELDLDEAETGLDHEAEADYFAGRLLVPRVWLREAVDQYTLVQLLDIFGVSRSVLIIAAREYRLLNKLQP